MSARGYIGEKRGLFGHWFVPARFRDAWMRDGNRLVRAVRESDGEFLDVRPVILARAQRKRIDEAGPAIETKPATGEVESVDTGPASETSEKRGRRGVRART